MLGKGSEKSIFFATIFFISEKEPKKQPETIRKKNPQTAIKRRTQSLGKNASE